MKPLTIGLLGASRISELAVVGPARETGSRLVAVAARDVSRGEVFAKKHGVERVQETYEDLLADPEVDLVYNSLINGLHAPWTLKAIEAGKPVLCEKPFASNAADADLVRKLAAAEGAFAMEAFHYYFHPVRRRMRQIVESGELGEVVRTEAIVHTPPPPDNDARWQLDHGGGAMMDVGCYAIHANRSICSPSMGEPRITAATPRLRRGAAGIDEKMSVSLEFTTGATGMISCDMASPHQRFWFRVVGTRGEAEAANFVLPQADDRIIVSANGILRTENLGTVSTFTHQLSAIIEHLSGKAGHPLPLEDAVATMKIVDATYAAAGMPVRPSSLIRSKAMPA